MHRLFNTFPAGIRGFGLLLLRAAVGAVAIMEGGCYLAADSNTTSAGLLESGVAVIGGGALLAGLLTPIAAGLITLEAVGIAVSWLPVPEATSLKTELAAIFLAVVSTAIVLLGPGTISIDARLFGRREIIIPLSPRSPNT